MNIYFACSITGGRKDEARYKIIVDTLIDDDHKIPTARLATTDVIMVEGMIKPSEVYKRDTNWIKGSDVLIAEVSTPSHGVGYEIGFALNLQKPVICIYQEKTPISKMILGNKDPNLHIFAYKTIEEAIEYLRTKLEIFAKH